ncbi:hypothetical protein BDW69DRAFT_190792, partial [Aspergillus filifer]
AGQTPFRPLQAYLDEASIQKHVRPWQQVLAFIARTQAHESDQGPRGKWFGKLPVYGMTPRQRRKWQALWQLAMPATPEPERPATRTRTTRGRVSRVVHTFAGAGQMLEELGSASPSISSASSSASPSMVGVDKEAVDDPLEAMEVEAEAKAKDEVKAWRMTAIEQACLEFCIELLNQRYRTQEYESALVCAMAVQGWGEAGWRDPDSYPPILSRVIKVARFMVVQKALWLDPHAEEIIRMWTGRGAPGHGPVPWPLTSADDQLGDIPQGDPDSGGSAGELSPAPGLGLGLEVEARVRLGGGKTLHDHVQQMVHGFMIRGTHGPMQTLLDWRTYGLK